MKRKCINCKWFSLEQDEDDLFFEEIGYGCCHAPVPAWVVDDLNNEINIQECYAKTCEAYKKKKEGLK